jgi:hypothetical protein
MPTLATSLQYLPLTGVITPVATTTYLPRNGTIVSIPFITNYAIFTSGNLLACYGKYNTVWDWAAFITTNVITISGGSSNYFNLNSSIYTLSGNSTPRLSTWGQLGSALAVTVSSGPKLWAYEGNTLGTVNTIVTATNMVWTVSTAKWVTTIAGISGNPDLTTNFNSIPLALNESLWQQGVPLNVSYYDNTYINLSATQFVYAALSSSNNGVIVYSGPSAVNVLLTATIFSVAPPFIKIYTPNRLALTGTNINFENLITNTAYVSTTVFIVNEPNQTPITINDNRDVTFNFKYPGSKTLTVNVYTKYDPVNPITYDFTNIVSILPYYDNVNSAEYHIANPTVQLPYPNQPQIAPNDWVTEDSINSCITKIYNNLNYLYTLGKVYSDTAYEYFGYLGTPLTDTNWNVNIPHIDTYYNSITSVSVVNDIFIDVVSKENILYTITNKNINVLDVNYTPNILSITHTYDGITSFENLVSVGIDSVGKIIVLDSVLSQVFVFYVRNNTLVKFTNWGGYGSAASNSKFNQPSDLCVDQQDCIWVSDTGNSVVKQYSNTGAWIQTIRNNDFKTYPPLSVTVDSQLNVHILTKKGVYVYSYTGTYLYTYQYNTYSGDDMPVKITSSYNREIIYIAFNTQVLKFFRTGVYNGIVMNNQLGVTGVTGLFQDEYRNVLITSSDKILKFVDIMVLNNLQGYLPNSYWSLNDILIHKEEYVQNWVYTKALQKLWDNIELFKNTLLYTNTGCKTYTPSPYSKDKIVIGQNEIVTSATVNRLLGYLWENFLTIIKFYTPNC